MTIEAFIAWGLSGGGAAWIAYWLMDNTVYFAAQSPKNKRRWSLVLAGFLATIFQAAAVLFGMAQIPTDALGWVRLLFAAIALAVIGSQAAHGEVKLSAEKPVEA